MPKIRVVQVITRMDWGGAPDLVRILCENLDKDRFEVTLVTGPAAALSEKNRKFFAAFEKHILIAPDLQRDIHPLADLAALVWLYRLFRQERYDIVHTHTAKAGMLGRIAAHFAGISVIVHMTHGHNFYGYFGPVKSRMIIWLERMAGKITDRIICLTRPEKRDLLDYGIIAEEKISLTRTVVEKEELKMPDAQERARLRQELGAGPDALLIGMIGRLEPIKGPEYFLEAAGITAREFSAARFIIAGEGSLRGMLEEKAKELNLTEKAVFTGWKDDIPRILAALDILVLPSLNEAVGITLIEAQHLGVPVIAANVGGIPEIIEHDKTGLLVEPANSEKLAGAIAELIREPVKREAISEAAKLAVKNKYNVKDFVEQISNVYIHEWTRIKTRMNTNEEGTNRGGAN